MANNKNYVPQKLSMIGRISLMLVPAAIVLVFLPSCLFTYFEGWPYSVSVYYSFVTLSTIGFGDFIPTFQPHQERTFGIYFQFYQVFVMVWFIFGLSYILMLIGFIAKGMRSKRIARLEAQLTENIKMTHQRIWNGVSKDVGFLRRIINEVNIMRWKVTKPKMHFCRRIEWTISVFQPVFTSSQENGESKRLSRSFSCPELLLYSHRTPTPMRKRAFSEIFDVNELPSQHRLQKPHFSRHSETNLMLIDREKTFHGQNLFDDTSDVLTQVVLALNNYGSGRDDDASDVFVDMTIGGVDLFSEDDILDDEERSASPLPLKATKFNRKRTLSVYSSSKIAKKMEAPTRTWSGDNSDIQTYINQQWKKENIAEESANASAVNISVGEPVEEEPPRRQSIFRRLSTIFLGRNSLLEKDSEESIKRPPISPMNRRRDTMKTFPKLEAIRRTSSTSLRSPSPELILENTTIADLIRAIEMAHLKNHVQNTSLVATRPNTVSQTRRTSLAPPRLQAPHPQHILRQNSSPTANRLKSFEVTRVEMPSAGANPFSVSMAQRRRLSLLPPQSSMTPMYTTPIMPRRVYTKPPISPLAQLQPPFNAKKPDEPTHPDC